jgi:hypothetical protein
MGSWVGLVVGVGGLLVAALSVVLAYKERSAGLRGALYEKQVGVYGLLLAALADLHTVFLDVTTVELTTGKGFPLDGAARIELRRRAAQQLAGLGRAVTESVVFMPAEVADAVEKYRDTFVAISAPPGVEQNYSRDLYQAADPQVVLTKVFTQVWAVMRHQLGTDALSEQTAKLVGTSTSPLLPQERARVETAE